MRHTAPGAGDRVQNQGGWGPGFQARAPLLHLFIHSFGKHLLDMHNVWLLRRIYRRHGQGWAKGVKRTETEKLQ